MTSPKELSSDRPAPGRLSQVVIVLLLVVMLVLGAFPHYWQGQWGGDPWPELPAAQLKQLQRLPKTGLAISGWTTEEQAAVTLGGSAWSQQILVLDPTASPGLDVLPQVVVLTRGQGDHESRPQVEWTDLRGQRQWTEDNLVIRSLPQADGSGVAKIRFFRAWWETPEGRIVTLAVAQWYSWPGGGHWSTNEWFWQDWRARWRGDRKPWIAVALLIPIEPLGNLEEAQPTLDHLGAAVQVALQTLWETTSPEG